jgi:uncharacterized lipoprotein YehR (DUF1307 family)
MKRLIIILVLSIFALSACASAIATPSPSAGDYAPGVAPAAEESARQSLNYDTANTGSSVTTTDRIVIKNANLSIVVIDPGEAMTSITRMTEGMGGFVVDSNLYKAYTNDGVEVPAAYLTIRVPAEQLDAVLTQIKALVEDPKTDILSENITGQDVTMEYTDLQSRLRNLEAAEEQLTSFMDKATKIEEVMQVYNQLNQVRSDIEVLKGQIKYYDESARLSAVTVNLTAKESIKPVEIAGWKPVGIARDAVQALIDTLKVIGTILIWVVILVVPVSLVIGLPIWLIVRAVRRNKAKQKAIAGSAQAAEPYDKLK